MQSIPKKEANLFVKSEVSKKYSWLTSAIIENHKFPYLPKKDFKKLSQDHQDFLQLRWGELFGLAQDEWKVTSKFKKNENEIEIDCELCGHKELDLLSEIENMENGNRLIVGSTCIEKFDKIQNNSASDYRKYQKDKKIKERIVSNEEQIEQQFSGIISTIREFKNIQNNDSIILNKQLTDDYKRILRIVESDYEKQLKLKQSKIDIKVVQSTYLMTQKFLNDLKVYEDNCKSQVWGITPEIARWCNKYGSTKLLDLLKNFGEINKYTVDQIKEENHLYNVVNQFKNLFDDNNMRLTKNNKSSFNVISNMRNKIIIVVDTIQFLKLKKDYLFDDKNTKIDTKELLRISKISSKSYNDATNLICRHGNFKNQYKFYYADSSINEISYIDKKNHKVCVLDYNSFIQKFKYYIYENKIDMKKNQALLDYVQKKSIKYEKNDYIYHLKQLGIIINK
ncbi:MAG: hypothetical protein IJZ46_00795 [Bacilli bacterium]|nr:hypothetical protein [Bacilli bacterium]